MKTFDELKNRGQGVGFVHGHVGRGNGQFVDGMGKNGVAEVNDARHSRVFQIVVDEDVVVVGVAVVDAFSQAQRGEACVSNSCKNQAARSCFSVPAILARWSRVQAACEGSHLRKRCAAGWSNQANAAHNFRTFRHFPD